MRNKRRHKELRPIRLGVMQTEKTRYETPSFQRALVAAGLIDETTTSDIAWHVWQSVCRDKVVIRLSMELEKSNKVFLPSVSSPFSNGTRVLQAMTGRQIEALKIRLGVQKAA
jgi:hypothetical protein